MEKRDKYMTIKDYSTLTGYSLKSIINLIKLELLILVEINGTNYIDTESLKLEPYLSVREYSKIMDVHTSAIYNNRKRGRLDLIPVNGILLVDTASYKAGKSGRPKKETI